MNGSIDYVASFNSFMNENEKEKEPCECEVEEVEHNLYNKEKPKYRKKALTTIFRMDNKEKNKYSSKKK